MAAPTAQNKPLPHSLGLAAEPAHGEGTSSAVERALSELANRHQEGDEAPSSWAPMRNPLFRALWVATLFSNLGTWIHEVAGSWMMTELRPDPWMQSLVQVATTTPMFLLALPAGALADVVDRRKYLLLTQGWMAATAALMAWAALYGGLGPHGLLWGTAILAVGTALNSPAWHSVLPTVVPRQSLPAAVTLNGLAISLARALGPGVAGVMLIFLSPGWGFAFNAVSFLGVLWVLYQWKPNDPPQRVRSERFFSALRVGVQHVRHNPRLRNVLLRTSLFVFGSSALWALLPLLVRNVYGLQADHYGGLVGLFGIGAALSSTTFLPRVRQLLSTNALIDAHWAFFALVMAGLGVSRWPGVPFVLMFLAGVGWIGILSCLHLSVQSLAPGWVRARAMSVYLLCFFLAAAAGSAFWGVLASRTGLREAMLSAAAVLGVSCLSSVLAPVESGEKLKLHPSRPWPEPEVAIDIDQQHGPVLVTVEYNIPPQHAQEFCQRMQGLKLHRLQNGVLRWGLFVDLENPRLYREVYLEECWEAHLRQHERVTAQEWEEAEKAYRLHEGDEMPRVTHLFMVDDLAAAPSSRPG
jgi:MFS family permease